MDQKFNFITKYYSDLENSLKELDKNLLLKITNHILKKIKNKSQIFVAGNGGSASIANHFLCDLNKGILLSSKSKLNPKIISLTNSMEMITAISNDISYDDIFSLQLKNYANKDDCLICFSCSGKSKNIIKAIKFANKNNIEVIFFQGFGSKIPGLKTKYYLNIDHKNYGVTEDVFSSFIHIISQSIRSLHHKKNHIL